MWFINNGLSYLNSNNAVLIGKEVFIKGLKLKLVM